MGVLHHTHSLAAQWNRRVPRHRLRAAASLLAAFTLAATALIAVSAAPSYARHADPDTIALVDAQGRFEVLSELSTDARTTSYYFGRSGDLPLMGDWNCDGVDTPGVYRPSTGAVYLRDSHSSGVADRTFHFGNPGDRAIAGDFDGDKCDTVSVYRPLGAMAYIRHVLASGVADKDFMFGNPGDRPFVGDFDGNGEDTIGLRRDANGSVYLAKAHRTATAKAIAFGIPGDQIIAGDWDGDGVDTIAAYRPSNGMFYYRNSNSTGAGQGSLFVGRGLTVVPVAGMKQGAIAGPVFDPGDPEPTPAAPAPTPAPNPGPSTTTPTPTPTPTVPPPVSTGEPVSVPGFVAPPPRAASGPISISGESNAVIENVHISNPGGTCVHVTNASNVTIRNSTIGPCGDEAVYLSDVDGAVVSGNYISGTGNGVLVHRSDSVKVDGNAFVEAGRNFVQFDKVNGSGSSVSGNRGANELGGSNAEDFISLWQSNGTASSPIRVVGNHMRSGGPSDSGSGIMLGDGGGSYQFVEGNVLVDPGQVGIGVASGTSITVRSNLVYSSAVPWSNVGIYVWNQYGSACGGVEVSGNQVNWTAAGGYANAWWSGGGCGSVNLSGNNWSASVGPDDF